MDAAFHDCLGALVQRVRDDLERIAHPRMPWLEPRTGPDGKPALDVLVVGAGQSGIAAAFGLKRARVDNILQLDRAEPGLEGPWKTYARMPTLRSPKNFTGPDLDVPSLTYQSWHEARFGREHWEKLNLIRREHWAEYLHWVRETVELPVKNGVTVTNITPAGDLLAIDTTERDGRNSRHHARKVLLATGQDGAGLWWMPDILRRLPASRCAHAADAIDFERLRGKRVAVLGAGASAFDNAATALEHGAKCVRLFCRRLEPQVVQPYRWLTFRGFLNHISDLDDAWRWRFMSHILGLREGFPQETYDRCARHDAFEIVTGAEWRGVSDVPEGLEIATAQGRFDADFIIAGTGVEMDFSHRAELRAFAGNIATWADRYVPPDAERDERLGRFPYLARDFSFEEKVPGNTPWIKNVHLFSIASTMSFGPSGSSINAMTTIVPKVVAGITRGLFEADIERHWASLQAYDVPQAVLRR